MSAYRSDWWAGLTVDHLFADCPNRTRAEASLRACRWWDVAGWGIDPLGSDVCGLCRHRWLRAHPKVRARERAAFAALLDAEDDEDERTGR